MGERSPPPHCNDDLRRDLLARWARQLPLGSRRTSPIRRWHFQLVTQPDCTGLPLFGQQGCMPFSFQQNQHGLPSLKSERYTDQLRAAAHNPVAATKANGQAVAVLSRFAVSLSLSQQPNQVLKPPLMLARPRLLSHGVRIGGLFQDKAVAEVLM
jgi:hypothetical protein